MRKYANTYSTFFPSDELLRNPHKGFTTFQRYRGDVLAAEELGEPYRPEIGWKMELLRNNEGLFRGYGIEGYPDTTIAYFRVPWRSLEPEKGVYNLELLDDIFARAEERGQKVMFRFTPNTQRPCEVMELPKWLIEELGLPPREIGDKSSPLCPLYFESFSALIRKIGERIDGHKTLSAVDISFVSAWGEGAQMDMLTEEQWKTLADAYLDAFPSTPLSGQFNHPESLGYMMKQRPIGIRADCLGDMRWRHMSYLYPRVFAQYPDAWKTAPIAFEVCWALPHWFEMGWDINFTIEQSLRWHISTFNAKSVDIPKQYEKTVEEWIKKMGYRFAIRVVEYNNKCAAGDDMEYRLFIENLGVAPIYHRYPLIMRLRGEDCTYACDVDCDIRNWLPGTHDIRGTLSIPTDLPDGEYKLELGITDGDTDVFFATDTERDGCFNTVGTVTVQKRSE